MSETSDKSRLDLLQGSSLTSPLLHEDHVKLKAELEKIKTQLIINFSTIFFLFLDIDKKILRIKPDRSMIIKFIFHFFIPSFLGLIESQCE